MTMGQRIAQLRKTKGLSQEELAEMVGVSRQAVSKWELDEAQPDASKIILLAQALGVTTDQLLLGEEADRQPTGEPPDRHPSPTPQQPLNALGRFLKKHGYKGGYLLIAYGAAALLFGLVEIFVIHTFFSTVDSEFTKFNDTYNNMPGFQGFFGGETQIQFPDGLTPEEEEAIRKGLEQQMGGGW